MMYSNESVDPVCCSEYGTELKGEAFDLLVHLQSNPPWIMTKRTRY